MYIIVRNLGLCQWLLVSNAMKKFTDNRNVWTYDELWLVEHYPVFTYGFSEKNILCNYIHNIPVFLSSRGGKITYHGPGQLVVYILLDLKRNKIKFRQLISNVEDLILDLLNDFFIKSYINKKLPGVYINKKKICSFGFRIVRGCSLHGFSLNINMDLKPFNYIYPCGDKNIKMTQLKNFKKDIKINDIKNIIIQKFCKIFRFSNYLNIN